MSALDMQLARLLELKEEAAVTVGMVLEAKAKLTLYLANPELAEEHFCEDKMRDDLNRYSRQLKDIQGELEEINGQIQGLVGIDST